MVTYHDVHITIAAYAQNITAGSPYGWRAFINDDKKLIPLSEVYVTGQSTEQNTMWEFVPKIDERGLLAWVKYYGDIHIDDNGAAHINLR